MPVPSVSMTMSLAPLAGTDPPLGDRRRVRVVVDPDRKREALAHALAEVEVRERDVAPTTRPARALVDRRRDPEADRGDVVAQQLLDRLVERREELLLRAGGRRPLEPALDPAFAIDDAGRDLRPADVDTDHPLVLPRGYDTPPNGPGRKALPRLPRRTREGPGADAAQTGARSGPNRPETFPLQRPGAEG